MWMKSKSGMYHKAGSIFSGKQLAQCQSYNLDRINELKGELVNEPPANSKICKKCSCKSSGKIWN